MIRLCPVLRRLLPAGDGEVLCACVQGILYKHTIFALLPSVQSLPYLPSDDVGYGDMSGLLQDHILEDDEPLRVPLYVPHPDKLLP